MQINQIVATVKEYIEELEVAEQTGIEDVVVAHLFRLREFLNNQPELEAGGAQERPAPPPPEGG